MRCGFTNTPGVELIIQINNYRIAKVYVTKYLELVVNEKLNWSNHINKLYNKLTPMIGALYRCNAYLTESNRYLIYNAYLLSNFRYLITIWGVCSNSSFKRAQVLQNKSVKSLFKLHYRTSSESLYKDLKLIPLSYILKIEQCKQIYKICSNNLKCNTVLIQNNQIHDHCTRGRDNIYLTNARTNRCLLDPLSKAIESYNQIPNMIKEMPYKLFLKNLKMFLNINN